MSKFDWETANKREARHRSYTDRLVSCSQKHVTNKQRRYMKSLGHEGAAALCCSKHASEWIDGALTR